MRSAALHSLMFIINEPSWQVFQQFTRSMQVIWVVLLSSVIKTYFEVPLNAFLGFTLAEVHHSFARWQCVFFLDTNKYWAYKDTHDFLKKVQCKLPIPSKIIIAKLCQDTGKRSKHIKVASVVSSLTTSPVDGHYHAHADKQNHCCLNWVALSHSHGVEATAATTSCPRGIGKVGNTREDFA